MAPKFTFQFRLLLLQKVLQLDVKTVHLVLVCIERAHALAIKEYRVG
jgi:hypothetical protein